MIERHILTTEHDVMALADEWRALHERTDGGSFADYDLFAIWWKNIGRLNNQYMLHVVTGREDGRLVAVLPLTIIKRKSLRIMQAAGFRAYNCDMAAENPEQAKAVWEATRASPHYDFAAIRDVYQQSMCYRALSSFARQRDTIDGFMIRLEHATGKEWLASLTAKTRANFTRCVRRLEETSPVKYEVYKEGPLPAAIIDGMIQQKVKWAKANKKPGLFYQEKVLPYFYEMLEMAAAKKRLFLAWVRCGDDVIAYNQGFIHQGTIEMPFWTYNPAYLRYSPGNIALVNTICWAIDNGLKRVDLRQGESQIKSRYCNEKNQCSEFTFSGTVKGRIMEEAFFGARHIMRFVKDQTHRISKKKEAEE